MKRDKYYYVGVLLATNDIIICTAKQQLAEFIGVHRNTITNNLSSSSVYRTKDYIISKDISITKCNHKLNT